MNKYNYYIAIGIELLLLIISTPSTAQEMSDITPAALVKIKTDKMWLNTSNSAGDVYDEPQKYSYVEAKYQTYNGSFHRAQQGKDGNSLQFVSEGNLILNKTRVWGFFSYNRDNINGTQFNSSIIDPYRGMPYYVADTVVSNWRNQHYKLGFRVGQPINPNLAVGIEGWYLASTGAKQMDPRTLNNQMTLILKPSVVFKFNIHNHLGANLEYYSLKEESNMSNVNSYVNQTYYKMYGLGTAIVGLGSGRTTNYVGNDVGGALQYQYQGPVKILLESNYNYKVEDVKITFDTPQKDASTRDKIWKGSAYILKEYKNYLNAFNFVYTCRHIDGIQYITQRDNSEAQQGWLTLYSCVRSKYDTDDILANYSLMKKRNDEFLWKVDASVQYKNEKDKYLLPYSYKSAENITYSIGGNINFKMSEKCTKRLLIGTKWSYNNNLSGGYKYNGPNADYPVVAQFETNDLNYLITNYYCVNLSAVYSQRVKEVVKANVYAKAEFNYAKANSFGFGHRSTIDFSIGCNF
jgi:hypothetical protein